MMLHRKIDTVFDDLDQVFQFIMLISALVALLVTGLLVAGHLIYEISMQGWHFVEPLMSFFFVPVSLLCRYLSQKGKTAFALTFYLITNVGGILVSVFIYDGFISLSVILLIWPIMVTGFLLHPIWSVYLVVIVAVYSLSLIALQSLGLFQPIVSHPLQYINQMQTAFLIFPGFLSVALLLRYALNSIGEMTAKLRKKNKSLSRFSQIISSTQDGVVILDKTLNVSFVNNAFCQITGKSEKEVVGKSCPLMPKDFNQSKIAKVLRKQSYWQGELSGYKKDMSAWYAWATLTPFMERGQVSGYSLVLTDISRVKESEGKLKSLAHYDSLTNLANRALFYINVQKALHAAELKQGQCAIVYIGLDHFKLLNSTLGHQTGDKILKRVAERLLENKRGLDTLARMGGDEFALLIEGDDIVKTAEQQGQKILQLFGDPLEIDEQDINLTASIGISFYPDNGETVEQLVKNADIAMFRVKELGGRSIQLYERQLGEVLRSRQQMNKELLLAIENEEIQVFYQPQYSLAEDKIIGVEALARWEKDGKFISPAEFIAVAEEYGSIQKLGLYILNYVLNDAKQWIDAGFEVPVSVNLSPSQFQDENLLQQISGALKWYHFPADYLELEITESGLMENKANNMSVINALKKMGVRFSMDDFGTGYSSLSYLKHLNVDKLKIDRSFVKDLEQDQSDRELCMAIIEMTKALNLKVIAEGVETCFQADFLQQKGCSDIQGYYYSKPLAFDKFTRLLQQQNRVGEVLELMTREISTSLL